METYYQIVERGKEDKNGNIVKVSVNGLEIVAGEKFVEGKDILKDMDILSNSYKILDINELYVFFQLGEEEAKLSIKDWGDYCLSAAYFHPLTGENCQPKEDWRNL